MAAALGLDELRWRLSQTEFALSRRGRWWWLTLIVWPGYLLVLSPGMRWFPEPRSTYLGAGGVAVSLGLAMWLRPWTWPGRPRRTTPAPDATVDALTASLEDTARTLPRRPGALAHALACAARAWAEEHDGLHQAYGTGIPPGTDRDDAVARLDRVLHDTADELLDGADRDTVRRRLARLDHALRLVTGSPPPSGMAPVCRAAPQPVTDREAVFRDVAEAFPHPVVREYLEAAR